MSSNQKFGKFWQVIMQGIGTISTAVVIIATLYRLCFIPLLTLSRNVDLVQKDIEYIKRDINELKTTIAYIKKN